MRGGHLLIGDLYHRNYISILQYVNSETSIESEFRSSLSPTESLVPTQIYNRQAYRVYHFQQNERTLGKNLKREIELSTPST